MDKQLTVLITRPEPGATDFATMLPGVLVMISPMMVIRPVMADLGLVDAVVITSSHAIPAVSKLPGAPTCFCVGTATTQKAMAQGLTAVMAGETAQDVAAYVIAENPRGQILYARGSHIAFDMVGRLRAAGLKIDERVVYDQVAAPLSRDATQLLKSQATVVLPLFSARSSHLFFAACPDEARLKVIAISDTVAETIPKHHRADMMVLPKPDAARMAQAVLFSASGGNRLEQDKTAQ